MDADAAAAEADAVGVCALAIARIALAKTAIVMDEENMTATSRKSAGGRYRSLARKRLREQ